MKQILFLSGMLIISLYFVVGGTANILINKKFEEARQLAEDPVSDGNGGQYYNITEKDAYEDYMKMTAFFPSYIHFGSTFQYILNLMSFGMLGAIMRILLNKMSSPHSNVNGEIFIRPILAAVMGLLMIVLAEVLPEFKDQSGNDKFYYSMAVLGGIYSKEFFEYLEKKFGGLLTTQRIASPKP